jgi:hypothetical protein
MQNYFCKISYAQPTGFLPEAPFNDVGNALPRQGFELLGHALQRSGASIKVLD